jgi:CRISPR system Cascade subunit CasA
VAPLLAGGCVVYHPVPVAPGATLEKHDAATLDRAAVEARAVAIAPSVPQPGEGWDRRDYFAAIALYNPQVAVARAALASAVAAARAAHAPPAGPTLSLTSEYAHDVTASSPWLIGGAVDVPLDIGGRRAARLAVADLATMSARYDLAEALWQARQAVRKALVDRLAAERQRVLLAALQDLRDRQLQAAERRLAAGEIARTEVERIRSDGANVSRRRQDAEAARIAADQALAAAIGVPAAALAGIVPLWSGFDVPADPLKTVDPAMRHQAILSRADVLKALADYQTAEANLRGEVAKQYPQITVSPGYTWERGLVKIPVSLGLVLPPLDFNRRAIAAAEAARAEAGKRLEAVVAGAAAAVDAAVAEARAARVALVNVRTRERPVADRLARAADRTLQAGTIDRVDWAAAQAGAAEAALAEIDALARVHAADAALEDALRRPVEGPETAIADQGEKSS